MLASRSIVLSTKPTAYPQISFVTHPRLARVRTNHFSEDPALQTQMISGARGGGTLGLIFRGSLWRDSAATALLVVKTLHRHLLRSRRVSRRSKAEFFTSTNIEHLRKVNSTARIRIKDSDGFWGSEYIRARNIPFRNFLDWITMPACSRPFAGPRTAIYLIPIWFRLFLYYLRLILLFLYVSFCFVLSTCRLSIVFILYVFFSFFSCLLYHLKKKLFILFFLGRSPVHARVSLPPTAAIGKLTQGRQTVFGSKSLSYVCQQYSLVVMPIIECCMTVAVIMSVQLQSWGLACSWHTFFFW